MDGNRDRGRATAAGRRVEVWLSGYRTAWVTKDAAAAAALFTDDASYRSRPDRPPHVGRRAIEDYWRQATLTQEGLELAFGTPVIDGSRAAVEWWAVMEDPAWRPDLGHRVTLPGCLVLTFADSGRCRDLREYYNPVFGVGLAVPDGWGG